MVSICTARNRPPVTSRSDQDPEQQVLEPEVELEGVVEEPGIAAQAGRGRSQVVPLQAVHLGLGERRLRPAGIEPLGGVERPVGAREVLLPGRLHRPRGGAGREVGQAAHPELARGVEQAAHRPVRLLAVVLDDPLEPLLLDLLERLPHLAGHLDPGHLRRRHSLAGGPGGTEQKGQREDREPRGQ